MDDGYGDPEYRGYILITHGQSVDLEQQLSSSILSITGLEWHSSMPFGLSAMFDPTKFPQVVNDLRAFARKTLDGERLDELEYEWKFDDKSDLMDDQAIAININWNSPEIHHPGNTPSDNFVVYDLRPIEAYLQDINRILEPVLGEAELDAYGYWETSNFGLAKVVCTETGFHVHGILY